MVILANAPVPPFRGCSLRLLISLRFVFALHVVFSFCLEMGSCIPMPAGSLLGHILADWSTYSYKSMTNWDCFGQRSDK